MNFLSILFVSLLRVLRSLNLDETVFAHDRNGGVAGGTGRLCLLGGVAH